MSTARSDKPEMDAGLDPLSVSTKRLIDRAIEEDHALDDVTTEHLVQGNPRGEGRIRAKEKGILAGTFLVNKLFGRLPGDVRVSAEEDGTEFDAGDRLIHLDGPVRTLLAGERIALNFLQHLSGVATRTHQFVQLVDNLDVRILDTRKTTPGWRVLEKYAVRVGGGRNHRMHLAEMGLVKENHLTALRRNGRDLRTAMENLQESVPVQVEVTSPDELKDVLACEPDLILLDNMSPEQTAGAVERIRSTDQRIRIEASGGIDLNNVRAYAEAGVDRISIGSLTHSAPAVDVSMNLEFHSND